MTEVKVRLDGRIIHRIARIPPLIHPFPIEAATGCSVARLADQVGGHLQHDGPQLVSFVDLLQEEAARYPCPDFPESSSCTNRAGRTYRNRVVRSWARVRCRSPSSPATQQSRPRPGPGDRALGVGQRGEEPALIVPHAFLPPHPATAPRTAAVNACSSIAASLPGSPPGPDAGHPLHGARRHRGAPSGNRQPSSKASYDRSVPSPTAGTDASARASRDASDAWPA